MKNFLLLISILLFKFEIFAADPTQAELWAATGLNAKVMTSIVNNTACFSTQEYFIGCYNALNRFLTIGTEDISQKILPITYADAHPEKFDKVITSTKSFVLAQMKAVEVKSRTEYLNQARIAKADKIEYEEHIKKQFSLPPDQLRPDFEKLIIYAASKFKNPLNLKMAIGLAVNEVLASVFDPHTTIQSIGFKKFKPRRKTFSWNWCSGFYGSKRYSNR